jgi:hypothetical protein
MSAPGRSEALMHRSAQREGTPMNIVATLGDVL